MLTFYLSILDSEEDKSKFELLYGEYRGLMYRVANQVLGEHYLTEDAVHEAFIRVARNFHKIGEVGSSGTKYFLLVTVRNTAIDILKREKKMQNEVELYGEDGAESVSDAVSLEDTVSDKLQAEQITKELLKLPVIYRDVLYLQYGCELDFSEIADSLGISRENAKKRAQRGRRMLQERVSAGL